MRTAEGCDQQCNTCNIMQQVYCGLNRQLSAQNGRLAHIEEALMEIEKRLSSDIFTAQGGDGALSEKVSDNNKI